MAEQLFTMWKANGLLSNTWQHFVITDSLNIWAKKISKNWFAWKMYKIIWLNEFHKCVNWCELIMFDQGNLSHSHPLLFSLWMFVTIVSIIEAYIATKSCLHKHFTLKIAVIRFIHIMTWSQHAYTLWNFGEKFVKDSYG